MKCLPSRGKWLGLALCWLDRYIFNITNKCHLECFVCFIWTNSKVRTRIGIFDSNILYHLPFVKEFIHTFSQNQFISKFKLSWVRYFSISSMYNAWMKIQFWSAWRNKNAGQNANKSQILIGMHNKCLTTLNWINGYFAEFGPLIQSI